MKSIARIIEDVKKEGGIDYKGAKSFLIAKDNSLKQEEYWKIILKKYYGEQIGCQYKIDNCHFDFKAEVITGLMSSSSHDILIPLDTDELLMFDDANHRDVNAITIKKYLSEEISCAQNNRFKVKNIYHKYPDEHGWWYLTDDPKYFCSSKGFLNTDTGYHNIQMKNNIEIISKISYLHYHFRNKTAWEKNTKQKLFARLGEDWNNIETLSMYKGHSHHAAKEYLRYKTTDQWHNLIKQLFDPEIDNRH